MPLKQSRNGMGVTSWGWEDAVRAGADPTGTNSSSEVFQSVLDDNTLLVLPEGTYLLDNPVNVTGLTNVGIVGMGDATITTPTTYTGTCFTFGSSATPCDNVAISNLNFDFTTVEGGMPLEVVADRRFVVEDIYVNGQLQNTAVGENGGRFALKSPDGVGRVARYRLPDGGDGSFRLHGIAVADSVSTGGHIRFEDCQVENFSDNGLYCSATGTQVLVDGGRYGNNGVSSVRFHSTDPSIIRGAHVHGSDTAVSQPRGVWLRAGGSHRIIDTTFTYEPGMASGPIETGADMSASPLIRGVRANIGTHQFFGQLAGSPTTTIRDCQVTGSGDTNTAAVPVTTGRLTLDNVSMVFGPTASAATRTGVRFDTVGCVARDCFIETTRQGIWIRGAECTVEGGDLSSTNNDGLAIEANDCRINNVNFDSRSDTGERTRYNGVIELAGAPTATNYTSDDAGTQILDTTTTTLHLVRSDGSLTAV